MWRALGDIPPSWLALIGALLGGSGLKYIEHLLKKGQVENDDATNFRKELREEVIFLRAQLKLAESDTDSWRDRYYRLMDENLKRQIDRNNNP